MERSERALLAVAWVLLVHSFQEERKERRKANQHPSSSPFRLEAPGYGSLQKEEEDGEEGGV